MSAKEQKERGIFRRGKVYWIRYADQFGRTVRQSANTPSKTVARKILAKKKTEVAEGRHLNKKKVSRKTFFDLCSEYWETHGAFRKTKGLKGAIELCKKDFGNVPVREITIKTVETFLSRRSKEDGWTPATKNRYRALLSSIFSKAVTWEDIEHNPVTGLKPSKENPGREIFLTEAQVVALVKACADDLRPIVLVALHTGMRRGEILSLCWSQVDFRARTITVRESKSGKSRNIPMDDTIREVLFAVRKDNENGLVFPSRTTGNVRPDVKKAFASALKAAATALKEPQLTRVRFHDLRYVLSR